MKKKNHFALKYFAVILLGLAIISAASITGLFLYYSKNLPEIISIADYKPLGVTRVLGAGGKESEVIAEFYKERRYVLPYEKIPKVVIQAFLAAEDESFFEHQGVNLVSILRALITDIKTGHLAQGGSTITQQVAKSLLLTREKSISRKIKELLLAFRMEEHLGKEQIITLYLNQINLGHHAYGVEAAARAYFNKTASELTIAEAAILAGLPQAPSKYGPHINPKKAKERQLYVLRRMLESGAINREQMSDAAAQLIPIYLDKEPGEEPGAYYTEYIRKNLVEKYGEDKVYEEGLTIAVPTTLENLKVSRNSIRTGLRMIAKREGFSGPIKNIVAQAEMAEFLKEQRIELAKQKFGYAVLTADGRLDPLLSIVGKSGKSDLDLIEEQEIYEALVTDINDRKKSVDILIGGLKGLIPFHLMKWAKTRQGNEATLPSQLLTKGDVIHVSIKVRSSKGDAGLPLFELEQKPHVQAALISMEVQTGYVLAMEGGYDFESSEFNRAIQAERQPGSAFKPLVFASALEHGFTPASIIVDSPLVYDDPTTGKWKPNNYEEKFYGDTTFRQALIKSRNIPTIKIAQEVKIPTILNFTKRIGMQAKIPDDLSISLGSGGVSLLELTKAYALFPRLGRKIRPIFMLWVKDQNGKILEEVKPFYPLMVDQVHSVLNTGMPNQLRTFDQYPTEQDPEQVVDPRVSYVMTHLMKEVVTHGTGAGAKTLGKVSAGKTGTTSDSVDAWFIGFTPNLVTGVWVGNDSQKPIGHNETGARAALPIWLNYMGVIEKLYPDGDFPVPPGIVFSSINSEGKLVSPNDPNGAREAFIEGTEPVNDSSTQNRVNPGKSGSEESDDSSRRNPRRNTVPTSNLLKEDFE